MRYQSIIHIVLEHDIMMLVIGVGYTNHPHMSKCAMPTPTVQLHEHQTGLTPRRALAHQTVKYERTLGI